MIGYETTRSRRLRGDLTYAYRHAKVSARAAWGRPELLEAVRHPAIGEPQRAEEAGQPSTMTAPASASSRPTAIRIV